MRVMGVLAAMVLGASLVGGATAAPLEPLVLGWERFFTVSWETWDRRDKQYVGGYVHNSTGHTITGMQLLIEGVDGSGQVTTQQIDWLGNTVPPFGRTYFEAPARGRAPGYRVRVFAFDVLQSARVEAP
jgi:hypothetical protein